MLNFLHSTEALIGGDERIGVKPKRYGQNDRIIRQETVPGLQAERTLNQIRLRARFKLEPKRHQRLDLFFVKLEPFDDLRLAGQLACRVGAFDCPSREGFGKHELLSQFLPHRLWEQPEDLTTLNAAKQALGSSRHALFSVEEDVRVQDTKAAVGDFVEIHRSHISSSST